MAAAKASAAAAAVAARRAVARVAARVLDGSANPDGPGLIVRGHEYAPVLRSDLEPRSRGGPHTEDGRLMGATPAVDGVLAVDGVRVGDPHTGSELTVLGAPTADQHRRGGPGGDLDPFVVDALIRMARLAGSVADALRDCPDARVRRSAAVLAARGYPLRAAFDA